MTNKAFDTAANAASSREHFASRIGFILIAAGCAIGIGNVWRFPYITGEYGGGAFVLLYLVFLVILGLPVMVMEFAVGRASQKSAAQAFDILEPKRRFHWFSWWGYIGCMLLMMFYTTVAGWMLAYIPKMATGTFDGASTEVAGSVFNALLANPSELIGWMIAAIAIGFAVCSLGLQKGVERITKWLMAILFVVMIILCIRTTTLPGGAEGIAFYLIPDFSRMFEGGMATFGEAVYAAMGQAFFSLSLGIAAMEIFGSYMSDDHTLPGEAVRICCLDTFVAFMSGMIIFPACFSFNVEPNQGPALIFMTLPKVFVNMAGGRVWGALFFLFMTFASFTTVLAVFENIMASCIDNFGWSRKKATVICCVFILIASIPCVLGYNVWSDLHFIAGKDVLDTEDFLVSNLLLPIGSLIYLLFCVSKWGWGFDNYLAEANKGTGLKMSAAFKPYFRYILPLLILVILIHGLISTFFPQLLA